MSAEYSAFGTHRLWTFFCKLDLLQRTGSFKERGARNALLLLDESQKKRGVVAASAGNHALGLGLSWEVAEDSSDCRDAAFCTFGEGCNL